LQWCRQECSEDDGVNADCRTGDQADATQDTVERWWHFGRMAGVCLPVLLSRKTSVDM
jgi:hypothetical protein